MRFRRKKKLRHAIAIASALLLTAGCRDRCNSSAEGTAADASPPLSVHDASRDQAATSVAAWPAFPMTEEAARDVLEARWVTDGESGGEANADLIGRLLRARVSDGHVIVGTERIDREIDNARNHTHGHPADDGGGFYLLWGTNHDSRPQVDEFRRLTGLNTTLKWDRVVLEQLRATGRWTGLPSSSSDDDGGGGGGDLQAGDSSALTRWYVSRDDNAFAELRTAQSRDDYAAWKFGYLDSVLGIVSDAPVAHHPVDGCDMPLSLQQKLPPKVREVYGNAMRELHCALALRDALAASSSSSSSSPRIAMLWGEEHIQLHSESHGRGSGFSRFLSAANRILRVHVLGGRPPPARDETWETLAASYDFIDPVLVPFPYDEDLAYILAAPQTATSSHFERKRVRDVVKTTAEAGTDDAAALESRFTSSLAIPDAVVMVDRTKIPLDPTSTKKVVPIQLAAGPHTISAPRRPTTTMLASFVVPQGGFVEIRLERTEPELTITVHEPRLP